MDNWLKNRVPSTPEYRIKIVKRMYYGGFCHLCQELADYKVLYKLPDITLVEYFCEKHKSQIPK